MKKFTLLIIFLIIITLAIIYNLFHSNKDIKTNLILNNKIAEISRLNTNLLIFTKSHSQYKNYDLVEKNISEINDLFKNLQKIENNELYIKLTNLKTLIDKQIQIIQKQKSFDAIYNNSLRNVQKIKSSIKTNKFDNIYNIALTLNFQENIYNQEIKKELESISVYSVEESILVKHLNIIFKYYLKKHELLNKMEELHIQKEFKRVIVEFEEYSNKILKTSNNFIYILFIILFIFIVILTTYAYLLLRNKIELEKMKKALDISDNIVLITDINHKIKYVNKGFENNTGFKKEEAIGKSPSLFSSGELDTGFYKNLHKTIHEGKEWKGEFINKNKNGDLVYEKSTITPIKDENDNIVEFLAIKLDITKEREYQDIFLQQSKMASMGELLENISHQWRQPLSIISSLSSAQIIDLEINEKIEKERLIRSYEQIFNTTQELSKTIDNLKDFFNNDEELIVFDIKNTITKTLHLFKTKLELSNINISTKTKSVQLSGKESELIQALIHILSNSVDAFETNDIQERYLEIKADSVDSELVIRIKDNAGGIKEDIIHNIFDLYFTTKHKYVGAGIGLYMTYQIITKILKGTITIENSEITVLNKKEKGVLVTINVPIKN